MRLAYVCADRGIPVLGAKGASVHVRQITGALVARGHAVHLRCARLGEGNTAPAFSTIECAESEEELERSLIDLFRAVDIDVVIERYSLESGAARRASARARVPHVLEVNAPLVLEAARWRGLRDVDAHLVREQAAFAAADGVIVVSSQLAEYVAQRAPGVPIWRIPNGADVEGISAAARCATARTGDGVVVGFTGSMKPWHGVYELLDAFARVRSSHRDTTLVLVGTGPEAPGVAERIRREPGLRESVRCLGEQPHHRIPALLAGFDVGVAPYLASDDFYFSPLKVVEYMAAGLPVVHPCLGDLESLVADAGISYGPDEPNGLARALTAAVSNPTLRSARSARARARAERLSWDATAARVENVAHAMVSSVATSSA